MDSISWAMVSTTYSKVFTRSVSKGTGHLLHNLKKQGYTEGFCPGSKQQTIYTGSIVPGCHASHTPPHPRPTYTLILNTGIHTFCEVWSHHHLSSLVTIKEKMVYLHILQFDKFTGVCYHIRNTASDRQGSLPLICHKFLYSSSQYPEGRWLQMHKRQSCTEMLFMMLCLYLSPTLYP